MRFFFVNLGSREFRMLARVREYWKLWRPVPCSHMSKLHFQDMTSSGSIMCPFIATCCGTFHCESSATEISEQVFSHHCVNFLHSKEPPVEIDSYSDISALYTSKKKHSIWKYRSIGHVAPMFLEIKKSSNVRPDQGNQYF